MATRCDPAENIEIIHNLWSTPLDPILRGPPYQSNRAVIDACRPWHWRDQFPKVNMPTPEERRIARERFGHLFNH